ncbi:hypothetical protein [Alicyclobacillus macrosporangiidus]|uniref:Uncharacterized protein n=1 Tax=Alicyclobacillus macrosporangiidus TaxID=392015 RepID=A0A1I7KFD1_9BACL|nr:hypothetical protein [Alicyclobacillus macrosporangiidus]SFU96147.1 hypothetical protein SAMN05421543_115100 [Alicyclobacillus macrosporangiidus]
MTKMWTLGFWCVLIVLVFVIGLPLAHAVSVVDTACFQAAQVAQTGSSASEVTAKAQRVIQSQLPTELGGMVLFDANQNVQVMDLGQGQQRVSVTYQVPVFGAITEMIGWAGPTLTVADSITVTVNSAAEQWVPYSQ